MPDSLHIPALDDRFSRFRLIDWWDQQKLANARILVVGAGALGNEIIKNLALLGIGRILVADSDRIENSNLSRSILYRAADNGQYKADVAARSAKDIYPDILAHSFCGNIVHDLGLGAFHWADLVIAGLDNREARLAINRACFKLNKPWIDGAIEHIQGTARLFAPPGPCYECTMSQTDWKLLNARRSCNLLSRQQMEQGKVPTTPTIASLIAAVQCQEALKLLHGMETMAGHGWVFTGLTNDSYPVEFQRNQDCYSHDPLHNIISLDHSAETLTAADLLVEARKRLGPSARIGLPRDILHKLICPDCGREQEMFASLSRISADHARCPHCDAQHRQVVTFHTLNGDEPFLNRPLAQLAIPPWDILTARSGEKTLGFELSADAPQVLGRLWEEMVEL